MLLGGTISYAQSEEVIVSGTVQDSTKSQALESATVFLETIRDSSLVTYAITDAKGAFELKGRTDRDSLRLNISYTGYTPKSKLISFLESRKRDLGSIYLSANSEALEAIEIQGTRPPIVVKQDTLEFNAESFAENGDVTLEDLLENIPGVEIDKDGVLRVNGKEVKKIMVNGKEFFGGDPKIALKNLPKELINKIQVSDLKTDEQAFKGEDGDPESSQINLTIDEDKNKGLFSRITAGAGTDDRFSGSGIANYFKNDFRVSVLAGANNINSPGFSYDEVYDAIGGTAFSRTISSNGSFGFDGISFGGGGDGITRSQTAGVNMANEWDDTYDLNGNYFFGRTDNRQANQSETTFLLPDRTYFSESSSRSNSESYSHRASGNIKIDLDTMTRITLRPRMNIRQSRSASRSTEVSEETNGDLINQTQRSTIAEGNNQDFSTNFDLTRKQKNKGYISLDGDYSYNSDVSDDDFFSERTTFSGQANTEIQDQLISQDNRSHNLNLSPSYRYGINDSTNVTVSYRYSLSDRNNLREVFDRETGELVLNEGLSNDFDFRSNRHRLAIGGRKKFKNLRVNFTGGYEFADLDAQSLNQPAVTQQFENPYFSVSIRPRLAKGKSIYLSYNTSTSLPAAQQLQPVPDRTNPTRIIVGNPNLDQSFDHSVRMSYNNYDWQARSGIFAGVGITFTEDQVTSISTVDDDLIRTTTYQNIDGNYRAYLYSNLSKTWKRETYELQLGGGLNGNMSRRNSFINGVRYETDSYGLRPDIEFEVEWKDYVELELEYAPSFSINTYTISSLEEQRVTNHTASFDLVTSWPENLIFGLRGEYNYFGNVAADFDNDSFIVIGSLGYSFWDEDATVKLKAYDLLDQIVNTRRNLSADQITDSTSLVLEQYFMLSFTYKFRKFGGKKKSDSGMRFDF